MFTVAELMNFLMAEKSAKMVINKSSSYTREALLTRLAPDPW